MRIKQFVALAALALSAVFVFARQAEQLATRDGARVTVHRHEPLAQHQQIAEGVGGRVNRVRLIARHADGRVFQEIVTHNLRTTGGADWQANAMAITTTQPAAGNYIAMSNDAVAPAAGDCAAGSVACTLTSEITTNGLARAQATYAHSNGTASYTLSKTFTATGAQAAQKAAVFNATSSGTMVFEATFVQVSLANGDTLTVQWTVSM